MVDHTAVFLNLLSVTDFHTAESCYVENYSSLVYRGLAFP